MNSEQPRDTSNTHIAACVEFDNVNLFCFCVVCIIVGFRNIPIESIIRIGSHMLTPIRSEPLFVITTSVLRSRN